MSWRGWPAGTVGGGGAADAAAWLAGLLRGSGLLLLNQDRLWRILDAWLQQLSHEQFQTLLPLLRPPSPISASRKDAA